MVTEKVPDYRGLKRHSKKMQGGLLNWILGLTFFPFAIKDNIERTGKMYIKFIDEMTVL